MPILRNKSKVSTVALVLVLAFGMLSILPMVSARTIEVQIFIALAPNPTGKGQMTTVMAWVSLNTPTASGLLGERWEDITITVTDPDGNVETLGPDTADPVGFVVHMYTPDQTGDWTFQSHFPGQTLASGDYYTQDDSDILTLVVQEEMVLPEEGVPYTSDYWERPIYGENRDWWPKTGNWLMPACETTFRFFDQGSAYAPYNDGPESPHIMWTHPITFGGLIGGEYGSASYYSGMSYEMKLYPPLVIDGRYYYNLFPAGQAPGYAVLDLRTGEELWRNEEVWIDIAQIYDCETRNQHGGQAYLWSLGGTYKMYDAFSGEFILEIENVTSGAARFGPVGEVLTYTLGGGGSWLCLWNSTKCIGMLGPPGTTEGAQWRPWVAGQSKIDWKDGIMWNVTVPSYGGLASIASGIVDPDVLVAYVFYPDWAVSIYSGLSYFLNIGYDTHTGAELWVKNRTMQSTTYMVWQMLDYSHVGDKDADTYAYHVRDQLRSYGFDINTGNQKWVTDQLEDAWGEFPGGQITGYGLYYVAAYDGKVHAYNLDDGSLEWTYFGGIAGVDTPYGHWPFYSGIMCADDKIWASNGEHSPSTPYWRGEKLHVIDAHTGKGLWNISGWFISHGNIVADGYFVGLNVYDNRLYCFGKGPSATTVATSSGVIAVNETVLIQGTVTDQSAGDTCLGIPAAGTPAIGDEYMSEWMEYLYMQQPCPMVVNGVPVKLEAFGEDGSYIELGWVTSDPYGNFKFEWTPTDENLYTVMATFEGSYSYGSSWGATGLSVGPAPEAPAEPEEAAAYTAIDLAIIAAVVVVAILVLYTLWTVRKLRK